MVATPGRAGEYLPQVGGYRAFIPAPLSSALPLHIDEELLGLLSKANLSLGRLDSASDLLPNPDLFVAMYVNKEAVLSSQIEGTQASLMDILEFEAAAAEPENPQDVEEVVNYVAALRQGLRRLEKLPLSQRLMREIHQRLLAGVRGAERRPGEFRNTQNWIGSVGSTINTAQFVPPPPQDMLRSLDDLEAFVHGSAMVEPLLKVGLVHAQFETIHPFLDGNGRMGRLLITFILCHNKILRQPLLYLSYFFKENKLDYYGRLQDVRDTGDWETWLKFFLTGVHVVAEEATKTARRIVQLREDHRQLIAKRFPRSAGPAHQLLEYLYSRPIITVNKAVEGTGQTFANANQLVGKFVECGILREMTQQQRNRRFIYRDFVTIFAPEEIQAALHAEGTDQDTQQQTLHES
jgi:Fic family protein